VPSSDAYFKPGDPRRFGGTRTGEGNQKLRRKAIRKAKRKWSMFLPEAADLAIAIAKGEAYEHLVNHKTGEIAEVPVNPKTRLEAIKFITERIDGRPEQTRTHELGPGAQGAFSVLLGAAAHEHWEASAIEASATPALPEEVE
jgi:hypothetical protein